MTTRSAVDGELAEPLASELPSQTLRLALAALSGGAGRCVGATGKTTSVNPAVRTPLSIITDPNKSRRYPQSADDGIIGGIIHDGLLVDL